MHIDSIIPFAFSYKEAVQLFKKHINTRFYVNKAVFKHITDNDVKGFYLNAFVFDYFTSTKYSGVLSYTHRYKNSNGEYETKTAYKNIDGVFEKLYPNITIEASEQVEQSDLITILPYEYASAVDFKEDFMHTCILEYKDKMFSNCTEQAEKVIKKRIENDILKKYNCDAVVRLSTDTKYVDKKYNYCLLSMYRFTTIYKDKKYTAIMNGQTGKVGNLPKNIWRVLITLVIVCDFIVGIVLFVLFFK